MLTPVEIGRILHLGERSIFETGRTDVALSGTYLLLPFHR